MLVSRRRVFCFLSVFSCSISNRSDLMVSFEYKDEALLCVAAFFAMQVHFFFLFRFILGGFFAYVV